jgi:mannosyltransferase
MEQRLILEDRLEIGTRCVRRLHLLVGAAAGEDEAGSAQRSAQGPSESGSEQATQDTVLHFRRMLVPVRTGPGAAARIDLVQRIEAVSPETVLLAAVIVVGAVIRLATLGSQSYWYDEATTAHELQLSFGGMLHAVHVGESTPPLYFIVAWLWAKVFGTGEVGLRSLSALLGIGLIPIVYLCGRELVSRAAGLVAAALAAVSPFMIWYSQEARAYMLFALLSGLSFLFWARASKRGSDRDVVWWAVFSVLAVLTHFFAAFLSTAEAILLLYRSRNRTTVLASAAVAAVQGAMLALAVADTSHPLLHWITALPRSIRIRQVPVDFGLGPLYQSSLATHGLLWAGVLALIAATLLAYAGGRAERRGAAFSAALAAVVVLAPIVLAWLGQDYVVARNLMPAWIPLAVVLGAACTVPRARLAGAAFAAVLLAGSLYADVRIGSHVEFQRPDWRGVARALGPSSGTRAIVAYDGRFATGPLAIYMRGIPFSVTPPNVPAAVSEVDVIGRTWQAPPRALPQGVSLMSSRTVHGFLVDRFAVPPTWQLEPAAIGSRAGSLLGPAPPQPAVLIQRSSS